MQWEYKILKMYSFSWDDRKDPEKVNSMIDTGDLRRAENFLNTLGAAGWEMAGLSTGDSQYSGIVFLKRPKASTY